MEALAIPGLHTVGLLLCMSAFFHELRRRVHNTQTSPPDQKIPRIVSRLHTLGNESKICRQAFPPGKHLTIPLLPNVTVVNALGDFSIARDRLAIIDGEGKSASPYFKTSLFPLIPFPTPVSSAYACAHDILHHRRPPLLASFFLDHYAPIPLTIQSPVLLLPFPSKFTGSYCLILCFP